jgi:hypothetical protein
VKVEEKKKRCVQDPGQRYLLCPFSNSITCSKRLDSSDQKAMDDTQLSSQLLLVLTPIKSRTLAKVAGKKNTLSMVEFVVLLSLSL